MITTFRLCQGLKEIDSIWIILKESKSREERKEERKLNILRKKYMYTTNTNTLVKQKYDYNYISDLYSSSWDYLTKIITLVI